MRTGYVQMLDNGNWEVVDRVGKKLVVLSGQEGDGPGISDALVTAGLVSADLRKLPEKHKGRERWEWKL